MDGWTTGNMGRSFTRHSGETPRKDTGPSGAAVGNYYMYAETSGATTELSARNYNMNFDLQKTFPAGQELYGIAFQYHMYGATMGSAVLECSANGTSWASLWSQSGNLGDQWNQATVYAGSGQAMLRYTCVPNCRRGLTACDMYLWSKLLPSSPHQVHVRIKLHG